MSRRDNNSTVSYIYEENYIATHMKNVSFSFRKKSINQNELLEMKKGINLPVMGQL